MSHLRITQAEFARQAETFAGAPLLSTADLTERVAEAAVGRPDWRVLDVACGPGLLLPALASRAPRVVGLDCTPEVLHLARQRLGDAASHVALVHGVAEVLPFRDASFDAAVLRLALHHVEDPGVVLRQVRRVLRPGGRVVVLDILTSSDPQVADLHNAIERLRDPSHVQLVAEDALVAAVEDAGFILRRGTNWEAPRLYTEWATIIAEPRRMASLETVLRHLARAGISAGVDLREEAGDLRLTYAFALLVAEAP